MVDSTTPHTRMTRRAPGHTLATARHFAALGADLTLVARRRDRIEALARELSPDGVKAVAGRVARLGSGVCNSTRFGVGAFSESLRHEATTRRVRVSLVEPGLVRTGLLGHLREGLRDEVRERFGAIEIPIRPTSQAL